MKKVICIILAAAFCILGCQNINVDTGIVDAPTIALPSGAYGADQSVTITHTDPAAVIRYTTNGSLPTAASTAYTVPIAAGFGQTTVRAIATKPGLRDSPAVSADIRVVWRKVNTSLPFDTGYTSFADQPSAVAINPSTDSAILLYGIQKTPGGLKQLLWSSFNPSTGGWEYPSIAEPEERITARLVCKDLALYLGGGTDIGNSTFNTKIMKYTTDSGWSEYSTADYTGRRMASIVPTSSGIYLIGGRSDLSDPLTTTNLVELCTSTAITVKAALPKKIAYSTALEFNGEIYEFGGMEGDSSPTIPQQVKYIFKYNSGLDTWTQLNDLPNTVCAPSSILWPDIVNGDVKILVFANHVPEAGGTPQKGEPLFYDPVHDTWRIGTTLEGDDTMYSAAVILDAKIFVFSNTGNVWEYRPDIDF